MRLISHDVVMTENNSRPVPQFHNLPEFLRNDSGTSSAFSLLHNCNVRRLAQPIAFSQPFVTVSLFILRVLKRLALRTPYIATRSRPMSMPRQNSSYTRLHHIILFHK